jgi:hypothetical protein
MTLRELETIALTRDLPEHGLTTGQLGVIVHVHSPTLAEVEFIAPTGSTLLVTAIPADAIQPAESRVRQGR